MRTETVEVTITKTIEVTIDETKFDDEFIEEFKESFYDLDNIEEHIENLAGLCANGIAYNNDFIEGYGETKEMGISFKVVNEDTEYEIL